MASGSAPPTSSSRRFRPSGGHRGLRGRGPTSAPAAGGAATGAVAPTAPSPPTESSARDRGTGTGLTRGEIILDIQGLKTYFFTYDGVVRALEGIDLQARAGETTGIVGETGCGKSVTAFSVARLIGDPGRVISGKVMFRGANLLWNLEREARYKRVRGSNRVKVMRSFRQIRMANERMSAVRGSGIGMIFQEPSQAMNPVFSISNQLGETVLLHRGVETYETILLADRAWRQTGGFTRPDFTIEEGAGGAAVAPVGGGDTPALVERMIVAASGGNHDELRAAAAAVAQSVGIPSLGTQLFYLMRDAGPQAANRRPRILRALGRARLSGLQREYVRHQRRVALLNRMLKELYLREMRAGKSARGARSRISLRITLEKWSHFYFGIWGLRGHVNKPVKNELFWRSVELLEGVRIANPVQVARGYPHELSGGMLQRVMIAMALSCEPALLLADEPTTALDVTIQAQILDLMRQLRERVGTAIVLITHDLGVVAEVCNRVNVMYAGLIVESGPAQELFRRPLHPYTQGLLASIPRFDQPDKELSSIPGSVPNLIHPPPGCRFHPRCPYAMPVCKEVRPLSLPQGEDHFVACHLYTEPPAGPTTPVAGA